jgi:membrane protease YdiL (CAAX protease family)
MSNDTSSTSTSLARADEPSSTQRWPWSPLSAVLIVAIAFLVAQLVGGVVIASYPSLHHWSSSRANNWLSNSVDAQFFFVLISEALTVFILWLYLRHRVTRKQLGLTKPSWYDPLFAVISVMVYYLLYIVAVAAITSVVSVNTSQQQDIGFNNVVGTGALILTFISLVILPPLVEEITFRGVLYGGLRRRFNPILAALGTSCLFAAPHLLESGSGQGLLWIAGIDTFVLSLVLCYLREKTGRLWAGMGVHAMKNGVAFISLFIVHLH